MEDRFPQEPFRPRWGRWEWRRLILFGVSAALGVAFFFGLQLVPHPIAGLAQIGLVLLFSVLGMSALSGLLVFGAQVAMWWWNALDEYRHSLRSKTYRLDAYHRQLVLNNYVPGKSVITVKPWNGDSIWVSFPLVRGTRLKGGSHVYGPGCDFTFYCRDGRAVLEALLNLPTHDDQTREV